jgi:hypothetical protein
MKIIDPVCHTKNFTKKNSTSFPPGYAQFEIISEVRIPENLTSCKE